MNNAELPQQYESWIEFYEAVKYYDSPLIFTPEEPKLFFPLHCGDTSEPKEINVQKWELSYIIQRAKNELFEKYLEEKDCAFTYDELYQLRVLTSHQGYTDLMYKVDRKMALESDRRFKKRLAGY